MTTMTLCECGKEFKEVNGAHLKSSYHLDYLASQEDGDVQPETAAETAVTNDHTAAPVAVAVPLDDDLQRAINTMNEPAMSDMKKSQQAAKRIRVAFSGRGWPNATHPGTVRDFMVEHSIPVLPDLSRPRTAEDRGE